MAGDGLLVDGLTKSFDDVHAVQGVSFRVPSGRVLGLLGPNGAGKTTTVNILATLVEPDGGSATIAGHDLVSDPHAVRQSIALTGQFAAVDEVLTGLENLELFGRLRGLSRADARAKGEELLQRFDLVDAASKRVATYSGGMRRRLDIAASLVVPVDVLFLDEPTTGLDPRSRADVWAAVRELRDSGMAIVLTTQYLEEADQLADEIVVIDGGVVVASGTPDELKNMAGGQACVIQPVDVAELETLASAVDGHGDVAVDAELGLVTIADVEPEGLVAILDAARSSGVELADVSLRRPTLDEVFLQLTEATA